MALTTAQMATLKAYILSVPALAALASGPGTDRAALAAALNADAAGPVKAWRDSITVGEITEETVNQMAAFDNLTAGKRDAWAIYLRLQSYDFTRNKIRGAVGKVWDNTQRDAILNAVGTENASVAENVLGGSSVAEGTVTALKRNWIGDLSIQDVADITA